MELPDGFAPIFRSSPFLDTVGPLYSKGRGAGLVIGLRVLEKHCNARGAIHGGVIATVCDVALGYAMAFSASPPLSLVSAGLNVNFTGTAAVGDWVESEVRINRIGSRLAFASCYLLVSGKPIAEASGVYLNTGEGLKTPGGNPS